MNRVLVVLVLAGLLLVIGHHSPAAADPDPCVGLSSGAPRNNPAPLVSGNVTEDGTTDVEGATMELFKCVSGASVSQGTDTTNSSGGYGFSVSEGYHYYVEAKMTGPLQGKTPSTGTENASDPKWVGPDLVVDFDFED